MATAPLLRKLGRAERALEPHNIAHQIDTIRTKVDEIIQALANLNTNVTGSPTGTVPAVVFGKWTGNYSTASADGVATTSLRSDTTLKYPPALGTPTKVVTLTNDGTEGTLLTADNTFSVNTISLKAPNATNTIRFGKYGNISMAGTGNTDQLMFNLTKTDFSEATVGPVGIAIALTNRNIGDSQGLIRGANLTISGTCADAASARNVIGASLAITGGNTSNKNFTGNIIGYRANSMTVSCQNSGGNNAIASVTCFESSNTNALNHVDVTDLIHFRARGTASLLNSATITNYQGLLVDGIAAGTNRYGVKIAAITGGTVATGVDIAAHSGGTTRRGVKAGNTCELTAGYWQGVASKGMLVPDTQGTPEYWAVYPDSTGTKDMTMTVDALGFASFTRAASATGNVTLKVVDTGTTAPTA